jgi:hypothetical protein
VVAHANSAFGTLPTSDIDHRAIEVLRSRYAQSGFRGVYRHATGKWLAKVRMSGKLQAICPPLPTPAHAATRLVRWYAETFGDEWAERLKHRKKLPWRVWWSESRGGWMLRVWEFGYVTEVVEYRRGRPTDKFMLFPSRETAINHIRLWLYRRYGMFAHLVLYKSET